MIRTLRGIVTVMEEHSVVIETAGVGYLVYIPVRLLEDIHVGDELAVQTYHYVREDIQDLYGFADRGDLKLFMQLIGVSGVGPRLGMAIISALAADEVKRAIIHGDIAVLTSVSGVGKKTAERIVLDLKDSIDILPGEATPDVSPSAGGVSPVDALLSLGYSKAEALGAMKTVDREMSLEEQVRQALKNLSQR